jgi:hypothetical protein
LYKNAERYIPKHPTSSLGLSIQLMQQQLIKPMESIYRQNETLLLARGSPKGINGVGSRILMELATRFSSVLVMCSMHMWLSLSSMRGTYTFFSVNQIGTHIVSQALHLLATGTVISIGCCGAGDTGIQKQMTTKLWCSMQSFQESSTEQAATLQRTIFCSSPQNNWQQLFKEQSAATLHRKTYKSLLNPAPLRRKICCNSPQKILQISTEPSTCPKNNLLQLSTEKPTNLYRTHHLSKE